MCWKIFYTKKKILNLNFCILVTNVEKYPKNPLKVVSFPELDKPFWTEYKRRQALSRKESKVKVDAFGVS